MKGSIFRQKICKGTVVRKWADLGIGLTNIPKVGSGEKK